MPYISVEEKVGLVTYDQIVYEGRQIICVSLRRLKEFNSPLLFVA